jgi:hypothetical protein
MTGIFLQYFGSQDEAYQECFLLGMGFAAFVIGAGAFFLPTALAALGAAIFGLGVAIDLTTMIAGDGTFKECLEI